MFLEYRYRFLTWIYLIHVYLLFCNCASSQGLISALCVCVCVCVFSSHPVWCEQDIPKPAKRKCQNTSAQPAMNINALTEKGRGRELAHPKGEYTHHAELYRQDFLKVYLISKEYISKKHYCNSTQWRLVHLHYLHLTLWRIVTTTDV